jgi:hypothetical protein
MLELAHDPPGVSPAGNAPPLRPDVSDSGRCAGWQLSRPHGSPPAAVHPHRKVSEPSHTPTVPSPRQGRSRVLAPPHEHCREFESPTPPTMAFTWQNDVLPGLRAGLLPLGPGHRRLPPSGSCVWSHACPPLWTVIVNCGELESGKTACEPSEMNVGLAHVRRVAFGQSAPRLTRCVSDLAWLFATVPSQTNGCARMSRATAS